MKRMRRFAVVGVLSLLTMIGFATSPSMAQPRAHVYLLRGLMNIFSLGMDTLAEKILTASMRRFIIIPSGRRLPTKLPPPIARARKAR